LDPETVSPTPAPVVGVTGVRELAFADVHALVLTSAGTIVSWGFQSHGELGHGDPNPAVIPGLSNVRSIATAVSRSFAVLPDGQILTWGVVPLWARVMGDPGVTRRPIPLTLKGLRNP
jgi:alpha-tubulin suppressor-like RCC1 family protein